jgi:hypothetical protein
LEPPFTGLAVNVTDVPAQIVFPETEEVAEMEVGKVETMLTVTG